MPGDLLSNRNQTAPRALKVAFVAPEFPPDVGGMQAYAMHLAQAVARRGHEVTVFTQPGQVPAGCPELRVIDGLRLRRRYDLPLFQSHRADVWHVLNAGYGWLASHLSPVYASVYGNDFLNPWVHSEWFDLRDRLRLPFGTRFDVMLGKRLSARALHRGFGRVVHTFACSRHSQTEFLRRYPQCRGRTSVGYVGVTVPETAAAARRNPAPPWEVVTICRLSEPRKNVDVVLRALAVIRDQFTFRYTVIGDGELRPKLEALAQELGLGDRVNFAGRVSDEELDRRLAAGDLFVLTSGTSPTSFEGFGIVYLEASARGVPVLAARCAGAAEAVAEGKTGWFVEQVTPAEVAAALSQFFRRERTFSPDDCREFARHFTWERLADRVMTEYERVTSVAHCGGVS